MSYSEIANQLGVTERTVRLRVAGLRSQNILQIVGVVNPSRIGLNLLAVIHLAVALPSLDAAISQVCELSEVRFVAMTTGEYHLMIEVCLKSHAELRDFMKDKLNRIEGIQKTHVVLELGVFKNTFNLASATNPL